jgi:hypothetical protein
MVRHSKSTKLPRYGDVLLAEEDGFVLAQRERDGQSGYWYLVYHKHDNGPAHTADAMSPMMSPINADGKATGYKCMTCQTPIHEGLEFLQKMLYWEQSR